MKRKILILAAVVIPVIFLMLACASIMQGTRQDVGFSSNPSGAKITVDGQFMGVTPTVLELKRKKNHIVKLELEGFQPYEATLSRKVSGWVWGNLVFGGIPGLIVDAITGGMYKLTPEQIQGVMAEQKAGSDLKEDSLVIAVVLQPDPSWEKIGQLARKD
ncbi:MAG TPA: PEGA domain-containing protein [Thermoanaerobaculia bacterium]|nr:PEGA domain-containing protein [Thermoanaerobaculia bacterium]HUM31098.1 PEGA domain-containing protein [Thermoanaerobaculia bacterium]HXK69454.1 PEGA domain-containing protein [Thermoanaerobaculia bacterium]